MSISTKTRQFLKKILKVILRCFKTKTLNKQMIPKVNSSQILRPKRIIKSQTKLVNWIPCMLEEHTQKIGTIKLRIQIILEFSLRKGVIKVLWVTTPSLRSRPVQRLLKILWGIMSEHLFLKKSPPHPISRLFSQDKLIKNLIIVSPSLLLQLKQDIRPKIQTKSTKILS